MKKDIFFFHRSDSDPLELFKIKNFIIRNKIRIDVRSFQIGREWEFFIENFKNSHAKFLSETIQIDTNIEAILVYFDFDQNTKIIVTDIHKIIEVLSE